MYNEQRGVKTTEQKCKVGKTRIIVESKKYNEDETYSKSIDSTLMALFVGFGESFNEI